MVAQWCVVALSLSGVVGGVGCSKSFVTTLTSGVMGMVVAASVFGVVGPANESCVCRTAFMFVSLPSETLVCLLLSPRRGEGLLLLAPLALRRFEFLAIVECACNAGTRGCVRDVAVRCGLRVD